MRPFYFFCEQLSNVFPLQRPFATKLRAQCASLTPHRVGAFALHVLFSISFGSKQVIFKYLALPSESQYICPVDQSPVAPGYTQNPFLVFCWPSQASPWHCGAPGRVKGFVFCRGGNQMKPKVQEAQPTWLWDENMPQPLEKRDEGTEAPGIGWGGSGLSFPTFLWPFLSGTHRMLSSPAAPESASLP